MRSSVPAIFALALCWQASGPALADEAAWAALARPGTFAVLRHALAPGTGDPADFALGDCRTQRNLSDAGRAQARRIGAAFAARGIAVDRILTSQWCRGRETATELSGALQGPEPGWTAAVPVADLPALNSFFGGRGDSRAQTAAALRFLRQVPAEEKLLLVSHFVNVRALTGVGTGSGEIVVFELDEAGAVEVLGEIRIEPPA
jgi:phosphohistidine phosphatase SixA